MTYLVGKKSVVTTDGAIIHLNALQERPSLGYSSGYIWLTIDRATGRIIIYAGNIRLIRKDSQKRVIDFVREKLLSYHSTYKKSGVIKQLLSDYDNLIATIKTEAKKRKANSLGIKHINDIFPVDIIVIGSIYLT